MKALYLPALLMVFGFTGAVAQQTWQYPLSENFSALQPETPVLQVIANNGGLTGQFTTRTVPLSTCPEGGSAEGYFFEDDAGLQFNNPEGFIGCAYSLQMIFQVDEFISPPPWVRLLSFTHTDDVGIYLYLTNAPTNSTLEFWPYGMVGEQNFFNPENFYQLTLVRDCSGLITVYINGQVFATYDDLGTQAYVPQEPDHYIVFFRDHPSVLANEASPGFVSNIFLADYAWDSAMVAQRWENFCPTLTGLPQAPQSEPATWRLYPNPAVQEVYVETAGRAFPALWRISNLNGVVLRSGWLTQNRQRIELRGLSAGTYLLSLEHGASQSTQLISVLP